jgi:hypothetical protein
MSRAENRADEIDAILARALRAADSPARPDCPDAALLAAWFDKSLVRGGAERVESHLGECPRCQGIVAAMARAESAAAAAPEAAQRPRWRILFEMRFLAPAVAGAFALVTLATVFHRRFGAYRNAQPVAALQTFQESAAAARTRILAKNEAAPPRQAMELQTEAMPAAPRAAAAGAGAAGAPGAEMPGGATGATRYAGKSVTQLKAQGAREAAAPQEPTMQTPIAVKSPDGSATWHVGTKGFISIVATEGGHFLVGRQDSGVKTDLLGGSAVSSKVCWVVGRAGTILLTTDGGNHWVRVQSPIGTDIAGVAAHSAQSATIRTEAGLQFSTTDGGETWKLQ